MSGLQSVSDVNDSSDKSKINVSLLSLLGISLDCSHAIVATTLTVKVDKLRNTSSFSSLLLSPSLFLFLSKQLQSDNHTDDVDKKQPNYVQHDTKAADAINNNKGSSSSNKTNGNFHSTALIKDVIHKKPAHREVQEKTEVEERVTAEVVNNTYSMSVSKTATTTKTLRSSFDSRERDYTYDDAIEDYKVRVSKASKIDLPKVDIHKRRELFEKEQKEDVNSNNNTTTVTSAASKLGTEIVSIKDRISSLRSNLAATTITTAPSKKVELPTSTKLKDRLSSLHQVASPVEEPKRNPLDTQFKNVQEAKHEFEMKQQQQQVLEHQNHVNVQVKTSVNDDNESLESTDREDSGIQTTDVSCSVSQADEQTDHQIDEFQQVIQEKITELNVSETAKEVEVKLEQLLPKDEEHEMEQNDDDESSVSFSEDDQTHSVLVLNIDATTNQVDESEPKTPNVAILDFIQCNLLDDHHQFDDVQMGNNFVYECIINQSEHQKNNGLEKSNSIDTALSLCSSSDGQSLMDDADNR